jgi:hypothetical protein
MFGLFKKKPVEVKHGHENYLSDYGSYEENDRNWILLLSALQVEAKDLDMWEHRARHDVLEIYPEGSLDEDAAEELKEDFVLKDISLVKKRMNQVSELVSRGFEDKLYYVSNCNSLDEVRAKAQEKYEDDTDELELFEDLWKDREKYKHTHLRLGFIAHSIWQIRLAVYFGVLHENVAWTHLEKLANFARPLMTMFDSWETYNLNIQQFQEIYEYSYPAERTYVERARICLAVREESPLKLIAFDFGVDKSYAYNIKSHSNKFPKRLPSGQYPLRLLMEELIEREDKTALFNEMDKLSGSSYNQEFAFIVSKADTDTFEEEDLIELPERYNNVYAYAMRAHHFYTFAWEARGSGTSDTVGEENYNLFYERLGWALDDLLKAYEMNPMEKNVWDDLYEILSHFHSEEATQKQAEIYKLIQEHALDHTGCVYGVSRFKQTRWGGSFEENVDWAREVIAGTKKGDPIRRIIYDVMIEHSDYLSSFQDDEKAANAIYKDKKIQAEVNQYLDELLENFEVAPYHLVDTLCYWYSKAGDYHRLRQVVNTMQVGKFDLDAMNDEYYEDYTEVIMNWFRSV